MTRKAFDELKAVQKKIVSDATCIEVINGDGIPVPGSLIHYPQRSLATAIRINMAEGSSTATTMFNEVRNCIKKYGFALWPVNARFKVSTLVNVQTICITANAKLLAEMEIKDNAHLTTYSEILESTTLSAILDSEPAIKNNADTAFSLTKSNWIPVCEVKDCSIPAEALKTIPVDQRVIISTGKTLAEALEGQAPLMICI